MRSESLSIFVSDTIGSVGAELVQPSQIKAMITLAHGAGAGMNHRFMKALAEALTDSGIATLRFNFPYIEKGKKMPDPPAIAEKTVGSVLEKARELFPGIPLFAGGKSFGGRMTSQYVSKQNPAFLKGIIFYGFPLHAPGKPSSDRAAHLFQIELPMLFLQGTNDTLASLNLIEPLTKDLSTATLELFNGANHSFKSGKKEFIPELAHSTMTWITSLL